MSLSSPSDHNFQQSSIENSRRSRVKRTKRKKIRKQQKRINIDHSIDEQEEFRSMEEILEHTANQDFAFGLPELLQRYQGEYRSTLHVKSVMGFNENVYKITNYENCEQQAKQYLDSVNFLKNARFHRVGLRMKNSRLAVDYCQYKRKNEHCKKALSLFLGRSETLLFQKRKVVLKEIEEFLKKSTNNFKENQNIGRIQKEILALCKLNTMEQHQILTSINQTSSCNIAEKHNTSPAQPGNNLTDEYITLLIKKNLKMSLDETPVDLLNYFKEAEIKERNIHDDVPLQRLSNSKELKQYLKSRKHRIGHYQQHCLRTCCAGCFSNHYEIYNPIESCCECGMRMHLACQPIRGKCQRCKYIRKAQDEKGGSQCCFLCQRGFQKGLLMQSCVWEGKEEYVHTFCLLIHGCWKIQREMLIEDIKPQADHYFSCKHCQKSSPFTLKCSSCGDLSHGLCAYLSGNSFSYENSGIIKLNCCNRTQGQQRLSFERKFKLNYQRILYKKKSDIYSLIQAL